MNDTVTVEKEQYIVGRCTGCPPFPSGRSNTKMKMLRVKVVACDKGRGVFVCWWLNATFGGKIVCVF